LAVLAVTSLSRDNQPNVYEEKPMDDWPSRTIANEDNHALKERTKYEDAADPNNMPLAADKADITADIDNRKVTMTEHAQAKQIKIKKETKEHHEKVLKKEMADVFRTAHEEVQRDKKRAYIKAHPNSPQAKAARKRHLAAEKEAKKEAVRRTQTKEMRMKTFKKTLEADNKLLAGKFPSTPAQALKKSIQHVDATVHHAIKKLHDVDAGKAESSGNVDDAGKTAGASQELKKSIQHVDATVNHASKLARHAKLSAAQHSLDAATGKVYSTIGAIDQHNHAVASKNLRGAIKTLKEDAHA